MTRSAEVRFRARSEREVDELGTRSKSLRPASYVDAVAVSACVDGAADRIDRELGYAADERPRPYGCQLSQPLLVL